MCAFIKKHKRKQRPHFLSKSLNEFKIKVFKYFAEKSITFPEIWLERRNFPFSGILSFLQTTHGFQDI